MASKDRPIKDRILLVGRRKGARAAARKRGWTPLVLDVPARIEQTPGAFGGAIRATVAQAIELCGDHPPIGVAAVATGSVVAAAAIRAHFGLLGLSPEVALRCHDKLVMKKAIAAAGLPCARWLETKAETTAAQLIDELGLPIILKLPIGSGGRGVVFCRTPAELGAELKPGLLAESFVTGTEMSVETFRNHGRTLFRNQTRYLEPRWASIVPAHLSAPEHASIHSLAERVHDALGIETGITHMEIFLTESGPVFGEIAARPPGGYLMELIHRAYGFDPWEAVLRLAVGETPSFPDRARRAAGVWILYPPAGKVHAVLGLDHARSRPGVVDVVCRISAGEVFPPRLGSGDAKGCILVEAPDHQNCVHHLTEAIRYPKVAIGTADNLQPLCGNNGSD